MSTPDWAAAAERGRLSVRVFTPAALEVAGLPNHPSEPCEFAAEVHPDDAPSFVLYEQDAETLGAFLRQMCPRTAVFLVGPGDSHDVIEALVERATGGATVQ